MTEAAPAGESSCNRFNGNVFSQGSSILENKPAAMRANWRPWHTRTRKGTGIVNRMIRIAFVVTLLAGFLLAGPRTLLGENWPAWRGPDGTGVTDETGLPVQWSEDSNVVWKTAIPPWGASTPAIWDDAIFLTTQLEPNEDDEDAPSGGEFDLLALRIDKTSGEIVWSKALGRADTPRSAERGRQKYHRYHNAASPSPVTDGKHVVFHFGNGDLVVTDFDGNTLWRRNLQDDYGAYSIWWGHANSPVIVGDLLISVCMQDSLADLQPESKPSYVVAHDLATGDVRWYTPRMTGAEKEWCDAYTTPLVRQVEDRTEVLVMGATWLDAYDPQSGERLWYLPGLDGNRTITGPTIHDGIVFATIGMRGPVFAAKIGGEGELPEDRILWEYASNTPDSPSPVYQNGLLFIVSDNGIAQCVDAATGELQWRERLGGTFKASPLAAEGRIYFVNLEGECTVVAAEREYRELARNVLDDEFTASPAVSDSRIYLRGRRWLYCLGTSKQ